MVKIQLQQFLQYGTLGSVSLGMNRAEVEKLLGEPDDMGGTSRKYKRPSIWKYGDIQIYFTQTGDEVCRIHIDDFDIPSGGSSIQLDSWIVKQGLSAAVMEQALRESQISYYRVNRKWSDNAVYILSTSGGVELSFLEDSEASNIPLGLYALSKGSNQP